MAESPSAPSHASASGESKATRVDMHGNARKGAKQYQEDAFCFIASANGKANVAAIFDGHGGFNGMVASHTARDIVLSYFKTASAACEQWTVEEWRERITALFATIHSSVRDKFIADGVAAGATDSSQKRYTDEKGIVRNSAGDPIHGGSTGTIVVFIENPDGTATVVSANVGDSAALMFFPNARPGDKPYEFLTVDHGPENPVEYKRVQSLPESEFPTKLLFVYDKANVFRKYECPLVFLPDGRRDPAYVQNPWGHGLHPTNVRYEPAVYAVTPRCVSKDTTCIAMTRALGDFYACQFGLSAIPDLRVYNVPAGRDVCITVASDGIWDCWKYEDFARYVTGKLKAFPSVDTVVEHSLSESIQRAVTNFGAKHYDDASLVVIKRSGTGK